MIFKSVIKIQLNNVVSMTSYKKLDPKGFPTSIEFFYLQFYLLEYI